MSSYNAVTVKTSDASLYTLQQKGPVGVRLDQQRASEEFGQTTL